MTTATLTETPRIYVACLASYNAGKLHGQWIDANQDEESLQDAINGVLVTSPEPGAEEWAIHDYDYMPNLEENPDLEQVSEIARLIEEHGEPFRIFVDHEGAEYASEERFQDAYCGEYGGLLSDPLTAYAEEYMSEAFTIPEDLEPYIDYERYARDLDCEGFWEKNGHIFRPI